MKGYRIFILIFTVLLTILVVVQLNQPREVKWDLTVSKDDKQPYGGYIFFKEMAGCFPAASVHSFRLPPYDQVNNSVDTNTAYLLLDPDLNASKEDVDELLNYASIGNYVFVSATSFGNRLLDTLGIADTLRMDLLGMDSVNTVNLINPALHDSKGYTIRKALYTHYFTKIDTAEHIVLGTSRENRVNFIKIPMGDGAIFLHSDPICFTNYFILNGNNKDYSSKAISYLPADVEYIYWDEYYKLGPDRSTNPLSFVLGNEFLKWAFRISLIGGLLYVLFELKRRQRIIPVIEPLRNSTLDFVKTVGNVYFNKRDNKNIATKKISYFLEFVRTNYFIPTSNLDKDFMEALAKKTGATEQQVLELVNLVYGVNATNYVNDDVLLLLNNKVDAFYKLAKQ